MFKEFFLKEIKRGLTSPMVYIFFFLMALLTGAAISSDSVTIGGAIGNINKNSPYVITQFVITLSLIALLIAAAFFNNAALRDHNYNFNEIMFSLPVSKSGYFFGRFFGALLLSTLPLLGIYLGVAVGSVLGPLAGWVDAEKFGPFPWSTLVNSYLLFVVPNMFISGAIIFFLSHKFKSTVVSFVGVLGIIIAYSASGTLLSDLDNEQLGALLDIFGVGAFSVYTKYWTPAEQNTLAPPFEGLILYNRLIWIAVGLVISLVSYQLFSFRAIHKKASKKSKEKTSNVSPTDHFGAFKRISPSFTSALGWKQFSSFYTISTWSIFRSVVFKILLLFSIILLVINVWQGYEYFGVQSYPVTYKVLQDISSGTSIFLVIIVVFFSGELVWRDREANIDSVINATPHSSVASMVAKMFSLITVAAVIQAFFVIIGVISQLLRGYTAIEFDIYLIDFVLDTLPSIVFYASLFVLIQTLSKNKYIAYFISILLVFTWNIMMSSVFEVSTRMLILGSTPSISYSDMNGFGPGLTGAIWFNFYWVLLGIILLIAAGIFYPRMNVSGFKERIKLSLSRVNKSTWMATGIFTVLWLLVSSFIYYNTMVINELTSSDQVELDRANYEKKYKKYQGIPQPKITDIQYNIDIFPKKRDVKVNAALVLQNKSETPIDSIHFVVSDDWDPTISIPGAELGFEDKDLGYRIYGLKTPMLPGSSLEIEVDAEYITKGFTNGRGNTSIVKNGSFFNNMDILPSIGYNEGYELSDKYTRKEYGLEEKDRTPKLQQSCGELCNLNYLTNGQSDWVNVETVISTSSDQIAIAPGSLLKEWTEDDRKYYHYQTDHPSQNFYSFMSADYAVASDKHNGIDVEIYYHPGHDYNIDMMIEAVKRSLTYYEKHFGPYYHKQARIIEFPRYATFAQAFPGTMPYSESFGFIADLRDETENNVIDAVIAHEMAHQWWAHQEIPANMQGGTFLTESFSEYSSLMVMKEDLNDDPMRMKKFLKYNFNRYLNGRSGEQVKELPLYKVENQGYIHYGKGAVVLYAIQDYIGEDSLNAALKGFLEEYRYAEPPYPNSYDFLKYLHAKVPDSLSYLVDDMIMNITLYDLRLKEVTTEKRKEQYQTTFTLEARKLRADTLGNETEIAMNDWIDLGFYSDSEEKELMHYERVQLKSGEQQITLFTDSLPKKAAIDPRRILIERITDDNVKNINLEE